MPTVISPKFSEFFSSSRLAPHSFFVKGTRRLFCECYYGAERYPIHWLKLIQACERLELPSTCEESSSPINAHSITRSYPFLDGGLISREGNYFVGLKGTWVIGIRALRFVCYELEIQQPRRLKGEESVRSYRELIAEIDWQVNEQPDKLAALHRELDSFR